MRVVPALILILAAGAGPSPALGQETTLHVSAAVSLRDALRQIASQFEQEHPQVRLELNFAGTSTLVRQVTLGAPCDVFLSADLRNMSRLVEAGKVDPGAPRDLLRNELVLVVGRDSPLTLADAADLTKPEVRRLALCDAAVPVGAYAREFLQRRGLLVALREKIIQSDHARAALAAVESGAADAAFVYRTDAAASTHCRVGYVPPPEDQPDIRYAVAVTRSNRSPHAEDFVRFLFSPAAERVFSKAAFRPLSSGGHSVAAQPPAAQHARTSLDTGVVLEIGLRTMKVAVVATLVCIPPGLALALLLARRRFPGRSVLHALVTLPMVLPPVAVGLLLLKLLSPHQPWASALGTLVGGDPLFTWRAAAIASAAMGLPLLIRTAEAAFAAVPRRLELLAASLGAPPWRVFLTVTLPLAARGVAYGTLLCFLRALGEFGATTLVAGNIEGRTETLALAIYSRTQDYRDQDALILALIAIALAVVATIAGEVFLRKPPARNDVR